MEIKGKFANPVIPVSAGLITFCLIVLGTQKYGAGVTPDTIDYLAAAKSLLAGKGFVHDNGTPFSYWPPLFPILIAAFKFLSVSPVSGIRFLNAISCGVATYFFALILRRFVKSRMLLALGICAVVIAPEVLRVGVMAWSEPVFFALEVAGLYYLIKYASDGETSSVVIASILVLLAALQRYLGISLIFTGALSLSIFGSGVMIKRLKLSTKFIVATSLPLGAWIFRNWLLTESLSGPRIQSERTLTQSSYEVFVLIGRWIASDNWGLEPRFCAVGIVFALFFWGVAFAWKKNSDARILIIFLLSYLALFVYSASKVSLYGISDRYVVPLFYPGLVFVIIGLKRLCDRLRGFSLFALYLIAVLWFFYPAERTWHSFGVWLENGVGGYTIAPWMESKTVSWLRDNRIEGKVISNAPDALSYFLDLKSEMSPNKSPGSSTAFENGSYLIWFGFVDRPYLEAFDQIAAQTHLEPVAVFPNSGEGIFKVVEPGAK